MLPQGLFDRFRELCEIALYILAEMHAQGAAAAFAFQSASEAFTPSARAGANL